LRKTRPRHALVITFAHLNLNALIVGGGRQYLTVNVSPVVSLMVSAGQLPRQHSKRRITNYPV
jgi:hypothetical protein